MKKLLPLFVCLLLFPCKFASAQQVFPYREVVEMDIEGLKKAKYKQNFKTSSYVLEKKRNKTYIGNMGIRTLDEVDPVPNKEDYRITVQPTADGEVATVRVDFYSEETYQTLLAYAMANGKNMQTVDMDEFSKTVYDLGGYSFELVRDVEQTRMAENELATTKDVRSVESYDAFRYSIYTGKIPEFGPVKKVKKVKEPKKEKKS